MKLVNNKNKIFPTIINQQGTVIVYVGILILVLIGFSALAVDIGHLYVARNELQNAADAGALAGARELYLADGTAVNTNANQVAHDAAIANISQNLAVEVNWTAGTNTGDIQRGHWSFATRQFTPSDRTSPPVLWDYTTQQLDAVTTFNPPIVNAVRVITKRESIPVAMTFAGIFGFPTYPVRAEAIAYLGFAGSLFPHDVDQPIAICLEALLKDNAYSCRVGRMFDANPNKCATYNSAAWTDFVQENSCGGGGGVNNNEMRDLINSGTGNPIMLTLGASINTSGGVLQAISEFRDRWIAITGRTKPWTMTLPVILCEQSQQNLNNCAPLVGAVELNVLWVGPQGNPNQNYYNVIPYAFTNVPGYSDWSSTTSDGQARWIEFARHYNLIDLCGDPITEVTSKSIYFLPDCKAHTPQGATGGQNFGILAKIPVLVAPPQN